METIKPEDLGVPLPMLSRLCVVGESPRIMVDYRGCVAYHVARGFLRHKTAPVHFQLVDPRVTEFVSGKELVLEALLHAVLATEILHPRRKMVTFATCFATILFILRENERMGRDEPVHLWQVTSLMGKVFNYKPCSVCMKMYGEARELFASALRLIEEWPESIHRVCRAITCRPRIPPPRAVIVPVKSGGCVVWSTGWVLDRLCNDLGCRRCLGHAQCDEEPRRVFAELQGYAHPKLTYINYETFMACLEQSPIRGDPWQRSWWKSWHQRWRKKSSRSA